MEQLLKIESIQNPRVKLVNKLRKQKIRQESGKTIVEGYREILRASESGWKFEELYFCPELFLDPDSWQLVSKIKTSQIPVFQCSEAVLRKMSYRNTPDGLIALSPLVGQSFESLKLPQNPLILVAENLEKPGNLGTILRTADATGVDAVIVCDPKTDINNPNVIRASVGTLFFIPIIEATTHETIVWLKEQKIQSIAALPDAKQNYTQTNLNKSTAIIVGSEDKGLSNHWKIDASEAVSIPMLGKNDSLNVSTAAAILLYEAIRQRQKK